MEMDNTDYLIEELKKINLPMPRKSMTVGKLNKIKKQLDEIEESIVIYRKHLERFPTPNP